ncbi:MAG: hypothetical protein ACOYXB_08295 [Bacteroidota bacterium]
MKKTIFISILLGLLPLTLLHAQSPGEKLAPLQPFLSKTWTGEFKAPDGTLVANVYRTFEVADGGQLIRLKKWSDNKPGQAEGYFYWDPVAGKIACFCIENNGVFYTAYVSAEGNLITFEGRMTWPEPLNPQAKQSYDFRNTFEFTDDGQMTDRWYQNAFGPWMPGHVIEFRAKP